MRSRSSRTVFHYHSILLIRVKTTQICLFYEAFIVVNLVLELLSSKYREVDQVLLGVWVDPKPVWGSDTTYRAG
jgi:hypothetical protein